MSKQGLSNNNTKSYKPMIKNYWTAPNLTSAQHKQYKRAAALMRAGIEAPKGATIDTDILLSEKDQYDT